MNFDTKHLVRWGIPGWIMIMCLLPFFYINYEELRVMTVKVNPVAIGAFLTVTGVPLGFLLNQIHHSLSWVIPRIGKWEKYFNQELILDEIFINDTNGEKMQERYRYLLSRKHELGGVTISLGVSVIVIMIYNLYYRVVFGWEWFYFITVLALFLIILVSRNYSSKNIDRYFKYYLKKHDQRKV